MFNCVLNRPTDSQLINLIFDGSGEDNNDGNPNLFLYGIVRCMALFLILAR